MTFGEKIAYLRKQHNMTQAELGEQLNVTYQAVSKWERDESQPDFTMMSRLAKIFGVTLSYFEEAGGESDDQGSGSTDYLRDGYRQYDSRDQNDDQSDSRDSYEPKLAGVCVECGRSVYDDEAEFGESGKLYCRSCADELRRKEEKAIADAKADHIKYAEEVVKVRNRGFIVGSIVSAVMLVLMIVGLATQTDKLGVGIGGAIVTVLSFFTVSQLFWDGAVAEVATIGGKVVGTPGVIFSFDLDGFIFLIVVKILFAIIRFLVYIITFLFFVVIAAIISPITFGPCLHRLNREIRDRRSGKITRPVYRKRRGKVASPDDDDD